MAARLHPDALDLFKAAEEALEAIASRLDDISFKCRGSEWRKAQERLFTAKDALAAAKLATEDLIETRSWML